MEESLLSMEERDEVDDDEKKKSLGVAGMW